MHRVYIPLVFVMTLLSCTDATIGIPALVYPINGEEVNLPFTFTWSSADNAVGYRIEVDTALGFSAPEIFVDVNDTSYTSTNLNSGIHYWRVAAYDEGNHIGEFSYPHSFEVHMPVSIPDVDYVVIDLGATLRLSWSEIPDADGYYIYIDGALICTIDDPSTTTYNASVPAKLYEVTAFSGLDESDPCAINCAPVVTASLDVWDTDESASPNAFGFDPAGPAAAYIVSDPTNWPHIDYVVHGGATTEFYSPHHSLYNDEVNLTQNTGQTDFDAINIAAAPGAYTTITAVVNGSVYYFWIDPTDNGWDNATDNFGKIKVEAIDGNKVTMKLAFQPIKGLRWCLTP